MKRTILTLWLLLSLISLAEAHASGPAPYTEPALKALNSSADRIGVYVPPVGATKSELVKSMVNYYSKVFSKAGYSFEKSIVQLSSDFTKDPQFISKGLYVSTPAVLVAALVGQLNEMRGKPEFEGCVEQAVSKKTLQALNNIRNIGQRQEKAAKVEAERANAAKKAEEETVLKRKEEKTLAQIQEQQETLDFKEAKDALEKSERIKAARAEKRKLKAKQQKELDNLRVQNLLKALEGHYENQNIWENRRTIYGTLDVKVVSPEKAVFSLYNKVSYEECKVDNQEVKIGIKRNIVTLQFGDEDEANGDVKACAITMTFKEENDSVKDDKGYDYSIDISHQYGGCRSYCERGGTMIGRYNKID